MVRPKTDSEAIFEATEIPPQGKQLTTIKPEHTHSDKALVKIFGFCFNSSFIHSFKFIFLNSSKNNTKKIPHFFRLIKKIIFMGFFLHRFAFFIELIKIRNLNRYVLILFSNLGLLSRVPTFFWEIENREISVYLARTG